MTKNLVIVESPAKAKTIQSYLGKDFSVTSSFGHIRDLPSSKMAVDIKKDFAPEYVIPEDKMKTVTSLKRAVKPGTVVWLATDEDREGEAIAWHLSEVLKLKKDRVKRITFHEITKEAVTEAVAHPRSIDKNRVDAQQARRVLDRLVGYEISPVLWRKIKAGLSAGRVQSVAVRLIVEREKAIREFKPERTFKLTAELSAGGGKSFTSSTSKDLSSKDGAKKFLQKLADAKLEVKNLDQSEGNRNPAPPFTTSTLQQAAGGRLGYSVRQTMRLAQKLYESGAITYMRTDSVSISAQAKAAAGKFITDKYGDSYHVERSYSTTSKGAQEAHEAIRPTSPDRDKVSDPKQNRLYQLIRGRFLASQMAPVRLKRTKAVVAGVGVELVASGEIVVFDGWLKAYPQSNIKDNELPELKVGQKLNLISAIAQETLSKAPARFSEAALVKQMEQMGIGRPSTYAPTISTIQDRGYVTHGEAPKTQVELTTLHLNKGKITEKIEVKDVGGEARKLLPTDIAFIVTDFLSKQFKQIIDYDFTANVEEEFDRIALGKQSWNKMIKDFYSDFHKEVGAAEKVSRQEANPSRKLGLDPKTKKPVVARLGRFGPMLQRGETSEDKNAPKPDFAPLPEGATLDSVTLEQALPMFELPRILGKSDDEEIRANIGRFGPYVQKGKTFASIPEDKDVFSIGLKAALTLIEEREKAVKNQLIHKFEDGTEVKNGRFGPYVTDGKLNAKVPKDTDPKKIDLKQAKALLNAKAKKA